MPNEERKVSPFKDPVVKEAIVAALRSDRYMQGGGALRKGDKFCCLGVMCDMAKELHLTDDDSWDISEKQKNLNIQLSQTYWFHTDKSEEVWAKNFENSNGAFLPIPLAKALGISSRGSFYLNAVAPKTLKSLRERVPPHDLDQIVSLATLNDFGVSFNVIADVIEEAL